jgi:predicted metal-dependent phosphoesterase TrpH
MGLADLHIHTIYSIDGTASVSAVLRRAKLAELDVISITDHDEIRGALKALELAPSHGVDVIPGIEITTAEGHLLALNITQKVPPELPLEETILQVGELGGICIAPHPMAGGIGMKSLSAQSIIKVLRNPRVAGILVGIEAYNATTLDRLSNHYASVLANRLEIARVGNSDAHVLDAIGLGATEFEGSTASDLLDALHRGATHVLRKRKWSAFKVMSSWGLNYLGSALARMGGEAYG